MPAPARVLILNERDSQHPKAGGAEVHVQEVFSRLAARGYEITQATTSFPGSKAVDRVAGTTVWRLGRIRWYYPRVVWTCARETRRGRFDVVVECLNKLPFYAPLYSKVPVLALAHHLFGEVAFLQAPWPVAATVWTMERLLPVIYRHTPFVSISESTRDDLIGRRLRAEQIRVIHCGINPPGTSVPEISERPLRVAYVGRLEPYKRVELMLRAMARLAERFPTAEIVVIGRGSDRERLERIARDEGLAGRTRFTGFVSDEERDRLLADTRVAVCPSPKEGWGLTVIECNALGTPVVASDAPGLRDSVDDGRSGLLFPADDVAALAERIARLLEDDALAARMSRAALDWSRRFDWDLAADAMAESLEAARRA
jgi:glycosyltransferase involved in cell wall biosynthesis